MLLIRFNKEAPPNYALLSLLTNVKVILTALRIAKKVLVQFSIHSENIRNISHGSCSKARSRILFAYNQKHYVGCKFGLVDISIFSFKFSIFDLNRFICLVLCNFKSDNKPITFNTRQIDLCHNTILTISFFSLKQREHNNALRFDSECADRDQPPPNIPDGPAHK